MKLNIRFIRFIAVFMAVIMMLGTITALAADYENMYGRGLINAFKREFF